MHRIPSLRTSGYWCSVDTQKEGRHALPRYVFERASATIFTRARPSSRSWPCGPSSRPERGKRIGDGGNARHGGYLQQSRLKPMNRRPIRSPASPLIARFGPVIRRKNPLFVRGGRRIVSI